MITLQRYNVLRIVVVIIAVLLILSNWGHIQKLNITDLVSSSENIYKTIIIILGIYMIKSVFFFIPIPLLYISVGMVLPLYMAILVNILGITLEITLTFFYGRFLGCEFVEKLACKSKKLRKGMELNNQNDFLITFVLRLVPFGVEFVSLMLGASGNYYHRYILASLMGITPKLIVFTIMGNAVTNSITFGTVMLFAIAMTTWGIFMTQLRKRDYVKVSI